MHPEEKRGQDTHTYASRTLTISKTWLEKQWMSSGFVSFGFRGVNVNMLRLDSGGATSPLFGLQLEWRQTTHQFYNSGDFECKEISDSKPNLWQ